MNYEKSNQWVKHIDFILLDLLSLEISLMLSFMLTAGISCFKGDSGYCHLFWEMPILFVCCVFFAEPYSGILRRGYLQELKTVICSSMLLVIVFLVYQFAVHPQVRYSRLMILAYLLLDIVLSYGCHVFRKRRIRHRTNAPAKGRMLLLAVYSRDVKKCVSRLLRNPYGQVKLCGIIILDGSKSDCFDWDEENGERQDSDKKNVCRQIQGIPIVGDASDLLEYCKCHVVDDILFYETGQAGKTYEETLLNMGICVHCSMVQIEDDYLKYQVNTINGIMTLSRSITPTALWQRAAKRCMDIAGGLVGCAVTLILAIFIAPVIKLQAPGPVFFSQTRIGKNGRQFKIYKFRSMYADAEARKKELMAQNKMKGFMFKMDDDPRIFPFGKFLRNSSLDEFPQFFNVLKGDMSLCGTRPPTLDEYVQYEPHHKSRLAMRPGITGMWQVSGRSEITDFEEVVRLDNEYIRNWSLSLDIKILFKTVLVVFCRKGSV